MKTFKTKIAVYAVALVACAFVSRANAECGDLSRYKFGASLQRQSWDGSQFGPALRLVSVSGEPIVGFWRVTFTSEGTTGIPDGTVVDQAFAQWHSDGTEIMNSGRPPVTQSFCLGVWKKTGGLRYQLNHFAISWDQNSNLVGPANIKEEVALDPKGNRFSGTFSIDQYDQAGNTLVHITGTLAGVRINADSPASIAF